METDRHVFSVPICYRLSVIKETANRYLALEHIYSKKKKKKEILVSKFRIPRVGNSYIFGGFTLRFYFSEKY